LRSTTRLTRRWLGAIGVAATAVTAVYAGAASAHTGSVLPHGEWTPEQEEFAMQLVHEAEEKLPAITDVETLEAQGFVNFGVPTPDGYWHWTNIARITDEHQLNADYPESLVTRRTAEGEVVEAAMYYLPPQYNLDNIPEDLAWIPGWHSNDDELCINAEGRFSGLQINGVCTSGSPIRTPPMMHVWRVDNACGHRFASLGIGGVGCLDGHDNHTPPGTAPGGTVPPYPGSTTVPPAPGDPGDEDPPATTTTTTGASAGGGASAPVAEPVVATPGFTG
jgi:hypothetical protein